MVLKARYAAVLLTVLVAVPACGSGDENDPLATTPAPSASASASTLPVGHATLEFPVDQAEVKQCEIFTGKASLPADRTLILGVRNLDNNDPNRYFQSVTGWEYPADLHDWKGAQWFGSKDDAAGQRFGVEVLLIGLPQAQKFLGDKSKAWYSPQNPPGSEVVAHITVKRVKGKGPAACS